MTNEQRDEIIIAIINQVEDRACARVGYHAEVVLKRKPVDRSDLSKIEAKIIQDKRYISRIHPKIKADYEILKNPDWKKKTIWTKYPFIEKLLLIVIAATLAQLPNLLKPKQTITDQQIKDAKQDSLLKKLNDSLIKIHSDQNSYSKKSLAIQEDEVKYSRKPFLKLGEILSGDMSLPATITITINNSGGDLINLKFDPIKGGKITASTIPKKGVIPSGNNREIEITNLKLDSGLRMYFSDRYNNRYSQDMIWNGNNLQLGILNELK